MASYTYDSWGKLISIKDGSGNDITSSRSSVGDKNPYRYRGYRYDTETGLYYLDARYYNPEWGRMINADAIVGSTGELLGHNIFAYCKNNPINCADPSGYFVVYIGNDQFMYLGIDAQAPSSYDLFHYGTSYTQTYDPKKTSKSNPAIVKPSGNEEPIKTGRTFSIGGSASAVSFLSGGGTISVALNVDTNGGVNVTVSPGGRLGVPFSTSAGITLGTTNLGSVDYLAGPGKSYGGSGTIPIFPVSVGYDYSTNYNFGYNGHTISIGTPGEPEGHMDLTETIVWHKYR